MRTELAAVEGDPTRIGRVIKRAALYGDGTDPHDEMFVRVDSGGIETPAGAPEASQISYCTMRADLFDRLVATQSVKALFPVANLVDWLSWFDDSRVRVGLIGEQGAETVSELLVSGETGDVRLDCIDDPALLADLELWLPGRFDGARFLDADGAPVSTQVETTVEELRRVVEAADRCDDEAWYPLAVADDTLTFEIGVEGTTVSGELDGTVDGPAFDAEYGPGFARVVRTLDGEVTLQTGPDQPLAVVQERAEMTLRYVLEPL